jgi:hypothetical protein
MEPSPPSTSSAQWPAEASAPVETMRPAPKRLGCQVSPSRSMGAECWFEGASCDGYGSPTSATLQGTIVQAGSVHGGCNRSTFALVYEPHTSPLRLRVCETAPPPVECPALVDDVARWDVAPLLADCGAMRALVVGEKRP